MSVRILALACIAYQTLADADVSDVDAVVVKSFTPNQNGFRALSSLLYYSTLPSQRSMGPRGSSDYGPSYRGGLANNRYGQSHYNRPWGGRDHDSGQYYGRPGGMGYNRDHYGAGMGYNRGHYGAGMGYNGGQYGAGMGYNRGQYGTGMGHNGVRYGAGMGSHNQYGAGMGYNRGHYGRGDYDRPDGYGRSYRMGQNRGDYSGMDYYDQPYGNGEYHWADEY